MFTGDGIVMAGTDDCVSRVSPLCITVAMFIAVMRLVASRPETVDLFNGPSKSSVSHRTRFVRNQPMASGNVLERHPLQSPVNLIRTSLNHRKSNFAAGNNSEVVIDGDVAQTSSLNSNPEPQNEILLFRSGLWHSSNIGYTVESHRAASSELTQRNENSLDIAKEWVRVLGERQNGARRGETRVTSGRLKPTQDPLDNSDGIASEGVDRTIEIAREFTEKSSPYEARVEETRVPLQRIFSLEINATSMTFVSTQATVAPKAIGVRETLPRPSLDGNHAIDQLPQLSRSLPKAIIIGVKKCGTRALLEFLRAHPEVRATGPETHFFDKNYGLGFDWYRRQMPPSRPDQTTIEKTPSYFVTNSVPGRIFRMSNETKLIVVVRDPVTRAVSHYTQVITKRPNIPSFERLAFSNRSNSSSVEINASWGALQIGLYAKHLENWLRYFPLDRMHFVSGEGLIRDPATELEKVQDFLGLRRKVTRDQFFFSAAKKGFPCLKKFSVVSPNQQKLYCLGKNKGRSHPTVDAALIETLRRFFRPHNERFYGMTKIDFGWP